MINLAYGYKQPENGDKGNIFWDALASNVALESAHNHNGTNSASLSGAAIAPYTVAFLVGDWGAPDAKGLRTLTKALPAGVTTTNTLVQIRDTTENVLPLPVQLVSGNVVAISNTTLAGTIYFK